MKSARMLALGLLIPAAMTLASCGKREDVKLAEFKGRAITIGEFERAYANVDPKFLPKATGIEGYREFLNTMLNKEIMAHKADELGYDKDPSVVQGLEAFKKLGLQTAYLKRRVVDKVTVSEDEIRRHYNNKGATLTIKQMLLDTKEEADEVWQLLEEGSDFDSVLRQYSKAPDASEGGNVMTVAYGSYTPGLQNTLFSTPVGEYTKPIDTPYGYFIIKVLRRTDAKRKDPYDKIHDTLEQEVRVQKEMILTNEVTDKIREKYGVSWFTDGLRVCFDALPPDRPLNSPPRRADEVYPLLYFDEPLLDKPVVTYKGKTITVKDFSDYYDQASFFTRPRREYRLGGIKNFLTERIMSEIIVDEMKASNIEKDPEVAGAIQAKKEELMVNRLWADMVNGQTKVDRSMIQNYYNDNYDAFKVPEKRRFGVILCGDQEAAMEAYKELQKGELFRNVAMAYSVDETTRKALGETDLLARGEQPEMDEVGFSLPRVGAVSEPFQTSRGWMILKLTERSPERMYSLDEARGSIEGALKQQLNEKRLNSLLEKWKEEAGLVIYEDALSKIQVTPRSAEPATEAKPGA